MKRLLAILALVLCATGVWAEKVADLPVPTTFVNDFAHMLTPEMALQIEDLARAVHNQAKADLFVVTINQLDDGQSLDDFTVALEEKWKVGKKGSDRSAIFLLVKNPHRRRIEVGYGLEGILNDGKVGAILDTTNASAAAGNEGQSILIGMQGMSDVIAADAHVTIVPVVHTYHREQQAPAQGLGVVRIVLGILVVLVLIVLVKTGNIGWAFMLLQMFMGGGGGGGGGGRDDDEGGFGGVGGGSSGGGGASRDF